MIIIFSHTFVIFRNVVYIFFIIIQIFSQYIMYSGIFLSKYSFCLHKNTLHFLCLTIKCVMYGNMAWHINISI